MELPGLESGLLVVSFPLFIRTQGAYRNRSAWAVRHVASGAACSSNTARQATRAHMHLGRLFHSCLATRPVVREQCAMRCDAMGCHWRGSSLSFSLPLLSPREKNRGETHTHTHTHTHGLESHTPPTVPNTPSCATSGHQRQSSFIHGLQVLPFYPSRPLFLLHAQPLSRILASVSPSPVGRRGRESGVQTPPAFRPRTARNASPAANRIARHAPARACASILDPPVCHGRMHVTDLGPGLWDYLSYARRNYGRGPQTASRVVCDMS